MPEIDKLCFWCGQPSGKIEHEQKEGEQVIKHKVVSYTPCQSCIDRFSLGVAVFETKEDPYYEKQPPLFSDKEVEIFPSGRWIVLPVDIISAVFEDDAAAEYKKTRQAYVDEEAFGLIYGKSGDRPTQH